MTINGAITQLVMMAENSMMPNIFRPALDKVIETISELEPQPYWIPCGEGLPEEDECVLVTDDYDCIRHCIFCKRGETWRGFVTYEEGMTIDAIAWQPLPSPYREEAEE